jgi:glycosyltransferase involved in cell wall biosynthesis
MPKLFSSVLSRLVLSKAAGGIAISRALKEYLIHNLEVSKHFPLEVVYYGYRKKQEPKVDAGVNLLKSCSLSVNTFKIGIIGRLVPGKDYPTLFKALKLALVQEDKIKLLIVGDGTQKQYLRDLSKKMRIENNVVWLGKIDYISEFLSALDLFVFTSKGEGFGLVLLEAMKALKPILATNNSAIPEVLGEEYEGLFGTGNHVELAGKIIKAIKIKDYSTELVKSYLPQIEIFNPQVMAARTIEMYEYYGF